MHLVTFFLHVFFLFLVLTAECLLLIVVGVPGGQSRIPHAVPGDAQRRPAGLLCPRDGDAVVATGTCTLRAIGTAADLKTGGAKKKHEEDKEEKEEKKEEQEQEENGE